MCFVLETHIRRVYLKNITTSYQILAKWELLMKSKNAANDEIHFSKNYDYYYIKNFQTDKKDSPILKPDLNYSHVKSGILT